MSSENGGKYCDCVILADECLILWFCILGVTQLVEYESAGFQFRLSIDPWKLNNFYVIMHKPQVLDYFIEFKWRFLKKRN